MHSDKQQTLFFQKMSNKYDLSIYGPFFTSAPLSSVLYLIKASDTTSRYIQVHVHVFEFNLFVSSALIRYDTKR